MNQLQKLIKQIVNFPVQLSLLINHNMILIKYDNGKNVI